MTQNTLYWHDYETFGVDPMRDRPVQFAGVRTDEDLNIIGEPVQGILRHRAVLNPPMAVLESKTAIQTTVIPSLHPEGHLYNLGSE